MKGPDIATYNDNEMNKLNLSIRKILFKIENLENIEINSIIQIIFEFDTNDSDFIICIDNIYLVDNYIDIKSLISNNESYYLLFDPVILNNMESILHTSYIYSDIDICIMFYFALPIEMIRNREQTSLTIYINDRKIWYISGYHGPYWYRGIIDISIQDLPSKLTFIAKCSAIEDGTVVLLDNVQLLEKKCPRSSPLITTGRAVSPLDVMKSNFEEESSINCDFEESWLACGWHIPQESEFDWILYYSPIYNHIHGKKSNYILYAKPKNSRDSIAIISTPEIMKNDKKYCLFFSWKKNMDTILQVILYYKNGQEIIWENNNTIDNIWHFSYINILFIENSYILFKAEFINYGEIYIDNISYNICNIIYNMKCNFDISYIECGINTDDTLPFYWEMNKNNDFFDHTKNNPKGKYMIVDASQGTYGDKAELKLPIITASSNIYCISFWYYINGFGIDNIEIHINNIIIKINIIDRDIWIYYENNIDIENDFIVIIKATKSSINGGVVAIDDLSVFPDTCQSALVIDCDMESKTPPNCGLEGISYIIKKSNNTQGVLPFEDASGNENGSFLWSSGGNLTSNIIYNNVLKHCLLFSIYLKSANEYSMNKIILFNNTEILLWNIIGKHNIDWYNIQIPFISENDYKIRFISNSTNVGLDNIALWDGDCTYDWWEPVASDNTMTTCDMESSYLECNMKPDIEWHMKSGPSYYITVNNDHTVGTYDGSYIYFYGINKESYIYLQPRIINDDYIEECFKLSYFIKETTLLYSKIDILIRWRKENDIWNEPYILKSIKYSNGWNDNRITIKTPYRSLKYYQIIIKGYIGNNINNDIGGEIGIDDIEYTSNGACISNVICNNDNFSVCFDGIYNEYGWISDRDKNQCISYINDNNESCLNIYLNNTNICGTYINKTSTEEGEYIIYSNKASIINKSIIIGKIGTIKDYLISCIYPININFTTPIPITSTSSVNIYIPTQENSSKIDMDVCDNCEDEEIPQIEDTDVSTVNVHSTSSSSDQQTRFRTCTVYGMDKYKYRVGRTVMRNYCVLPLSGLNPATSIINTSKGKKTVLHMDKVLFDESAFVHYSCDVVICYHSKCDEIDQYCERTYSRYYKTYSYYGRYDSRNWNYRRLQEKLSSNDLSILAMTKLESSPIASNKTKSWVLGVDDLGNLTFTAPQNKIDNEALVISVYMLIIVTILVNILDVREFSF
eukprot:GHVL01020920.1.p1 GENE.GHVL01020920.1~~GHVL01020920.1.p1  ORF type:complete len:1214 (+),score=355.92 GHVL01020920.1:42-3644(+)